MVAFLMVASESRDMQSSGKLFIICRRLSSPGVDCDTFSHNHQGKSATCKQVTGWFSLMECIRLKYVLF